MDALVTAGGTPAPGEPLYEVAEGRPKALIDVAGKAMAQWVLDALGGASRVDRVVHTFLRIAVRGRPSLDRQR